MNLPINFPFSMSGMNARLRMPSAATAAFTFGTVPSTMEVTVGKLVGVAAGAWAAMTGILMSLPAAAGSTGSAVGAAMLLSEAIDADA